VRRHGRRKSISDQKKRAKFSEFPPEHSMDGRKKGKLNAPEREGSPQNSQDGRPPPTANRSETPPKEKSATAASPQLPGKKIWPGKPNSSEKKYPDREIIKDVGSGLDSKRKGFNTILDEGIRGYIEEIVVTRKDRFCRFNFEVFEGIIQRFSHGRIAVLNQKKTSPEEELVEDLLSVVTVFSARLRGPRSHAHQKRITKL